MTFTFGICTTYEDVGRLLLMIDSIRRLNIPHRDCDIVIAGSYGDHEIPHIAGTYQITTDGWLPKKKNLIAKFGLGENIVLVHDYYMFDPLWYQSYLQFGNEWDVCSNPQYLITGERHFTDWVTWDHPSVGRYYPLEYLDWNHTKYQYVSGGYFLVKRTFLRENPLNEEMLPGSPEDVEWSLRIRDKAVMKCNPGAIVQHNKRHRDAK